MEQLAEVSLGLGRRRVPRGMHLCYVYNDDAERADVLSRFFSAGVEAGEKLLYVTDGRDPGLVPGELRLDAGACAALRVISPTEAYLRRGRFSARDMFALIRGVHTDACRGGYGGVRISGEMAWMLGDVVGKEEVLPYEARVGSVLAECGATAICQYDARRFSGETLTDMLAIHPYVIIHGQVVDNPYFTDPEAYLCRVGARLPH